MTAATRPPTLLIARAGLCAAASSVPLLLAAAPAWARDDGEPPGEALGAIETLLIYVAAPGALFVLIALLVLAPSMSRRPRYRPGVDWWAAPIWFNGPGDQGDLDAAVRAAVPTMDGGGASARW